MLTEPRAHATKCENGPEQHIMCICLHMCVRAPAGKCLQQHRSNSAATAARSVKLSSILRVQVSCSVHALTSGVSICSQGDVENMATVGIYYRDDITPRYHHQVPGRSNVEGTAGTGGSGYTGGAGGGKYQRNLGTAAPGAEVQGGAAVALLRAVCMHGGATGGRWRAGGSTL